MGKGIFDVDEIHALREEIAERWSTMTPEEICAEVAEAAAREEAAIEKMRGMTQEQIAALEAACRAAYEVDETCAE